MAEYYFALTDINNAIDRLIHACPTTFYNGLQAARNIFSKDLVADVQPVRHGRWNEESPDYLDGDSVYVCSVCGETWTLIEGTPLDNNMHYCPNCGARMGEQDG